MPCGSLSGMDDGWGPRRGPRRNQQWRSVSHGLQVPLADQAPQRNLAAWQLVLPDEGCFTHLTAAALHGWWLPPLPPGLPTFACQPLGPYPRRAGLHVRRHPAPVAWSVLGDLRVACPAEVLLACARDMSLLDVVVLVDAALHRRSCSREEVVEATSPARRRAGAPLLRRALDLADGRSESAWESLLRMLHVVCEVPVEPQHELYDDQGRFVARGDLWLVGTRVFHEYDGAAHLERPRQRKDLRRGRGMTNSDWTRRGYTAEDVLRQGVGILRDADRSLGRPHRPEQIRAWHGLLAESLFSPSGAARLLRRLGGPAHGRSARERGVG